MDGDAADGSDPNSETDHDDERRDRLVDVSGSVAATVDDPRVTEAFCRRLVPERSPADGPTGGAVTLLGVVHDHPASIGRVETVLDRLEPEVIALELPRAAVPLYRVYARGSLDADGRPRFGGEMSAAIRAAPSADVVGVDAPSWSFVRELTSRLVEDRVPPSTASRLLASLGGATRTALTCRLAATVTARTSVTVTTDEPRTYDCTLAESPTRQAEHERTHVATVRALLSAGDGEARRYRDETRESCMIDRLRSCRRRGDVVAVVGVDHLDALVAGLTDPESADADTQ